MYIKRKNYENGKSDKRGKEREREEACKKDRRERGGREREREK